MPESALFNAACNLEPLATWARKSLVRSAKRQLKKKIEELGKIKGRDRQIVQLATILENVGETLEASS